TYIHLTFRELRILTSLPLTTQRFGSQARTVVAKDSGGVEQWAYCASTVGEESGLPIRGTRESPRWSAKLSGKSRTVRIRRRNHRGRITRKSSLTRISTALAICSFGFRKPGRF